MSCSAPAFKLLSIKDLMFVIAQKLFRPAVSYYDALFGRGITVDKKSYIIKSLELSVSDDAITDVSASKKLWRKN